MAKSVRSKWKRKCRAIKRERYGAKELERLKKTLGIGETKDVDMADVSEIATVVDAKCIKEKSKTKEQTEEKEKEAEEEIGKAAEEKEDEDDVEKMEIDGSVRIYSKRTMRDQYGNYPVWMSQRKISKHKKGRAKTQKGTTKPQKRLTRKQKKALKQN